MCARTYIFVALACSLWRKQVDSFEPRHCLCASRVASTRLEAESDELLPPPGFSDKVARTIAFDPNEFPVSSPSFAHLEDIGKGDIPSVVSPERLAEIHATVFDSPELLLPLSADELTPLSSEEIDKMGEDSLKRELAIRGYCTRAALPSILRERLKEASRLPTQLKTVPVTSDMKVDANYKTRNPSDTSPLPEEAEAASATFQSLIEAFQNRTERVEELEKRRWKASFEVSRFRRDTPTYGTPEQLLERAREEFRRNPTTREGQIEFSNGTTINATIADRILPEHRPEHRWPLEEWPHVEKYFNAATDPQDTLVREQYDPNYVPLLDTRRATYEKRRFVMRSSGLSSLSVSEIVEWFPGSIDFLGDILSKSGAPVPLPLDTPMRQMVPGEVVYHIIESLFFFAPSNYNRMYWHLRISDVADALDLEVPDFLELLSDLDIKLPFGLETRMSRYDTERVYQEMGQEIPRSDADRDFGLQRADQRLFGSLSAMEKQEIEMQVAKPADDVLDQSEAEMSA